MGHFIMGNSAIARLHVKDNTNYLSLYRQPKSLEKEKQISFFCHSVGAITATCAIPRTGFSPGENIPINMHVENHTARIIHVRSALIRRDVFMAPRNVKQKRSEKTVAKAVSSPVRSRQITVFEFDDLKIPLNAPPTMRSCSCIFAEYTLVVEVAIPWSFDMQMEIPIVVAYKPPPPEIQPRLRVTAQEAVGFLRSMLRQANNERQQKQQRQPTGATSRPQKGI